MKTNFEAWRDSLTPEKMAGLLQDHTDWDCYLREHCPASASCKPHSQCATTFLRWANSPAMKRSEVEAIASGEEV